MRQPFVSTGASVLGAFTKLYTCNVNLDVRVKGTSARNRCASVPGGATMLRLFVAGRLDRGVHLAARIYSIASHKTSNGALKNTKLCFVKLCVHGYRLKWFSNVFMAFV